MTNNADNIANVLEHIGADSLAELDPRLQEAVKAVAEETASWRQGILVEVVGLAGGPESCTIDWALGVVQHAENGDKPEDLDRGELDPCVDSYYSDCLWERNEMLQETRKYHPDATEEQVDQAFAEWADQPINERPFYPAI